MSYLDTIPFDDLEPFKLSSDEQDLLMAESIARREAWKQETQQYRLDAVTVRQLYLDNNPEGQTFETKQAEQEAKAKIRMPLLSQSLDATLAQQHLGTFPSDENFFKIEPINEMATKLEVQYSKSISERLEQLNFMHRVKMDRMNAMLDGVSISWHPFVSKTRRETTYEPVKFMGIPIPILKPKKVQREVAYLEGTDFKPLRLDDWFLDPTKDDFNEANFIWRQWVHKNFLKGATGFENTDDIGTYTTTIDDSDSRKQIVYQLSGLNVMLDDKEARMAKDNACLFEEWGNFWVGDTYYENCVLIYSNDCNFHGLFRNWFDHGMKPFSIASYIPIPDTLYGKSLGKAIVPLVHAYDSMLNGAMDIVNSSAGTIWTYLASDSALLERFKDGKSVINPGDVIPVRSHDSLKSYRGDLSQLSVIDTFMQRIKEVAQEVTGGVNYATGGVQELGADRTATEVNALAGGTSTRYQDIIQSYEEGKLKPFLWQWASNDKQFLTEDLKDKDEKISVDQLRQAEQCIEVVGSKTSISQSKEANAYIGIMKMLEPMFPLGIWKPKGDLAIADLIGMLKQIGRSQGARNIEDYLKIEVTEEENALMQPQQSLLGSQLNGLQPAIPQGAPRDLAAVSGQPGMEAISPAA